MGAGKRWQPEREAGKVPHPGHNQGWVLTPGIILPQRHEGSTPPALLTGSLSLETRWCSVRNASLLAAICSPSQAFLGAGRRAGGSHLAAPAGSREPPVTTSRSPPGPQPAFHHLPCPVSPLSNLSQPPRSHSPLALSSHPFLFLLPCLSRLQASQTHLTCAPPAELSTFSWGSGPASKSLLVVSPPPAVSGQSPSLPAPFPLLFLSLP